MNLTYDPAENERFWKSIESIPGYPAHEEMPIRKMIFEAGAIWQIPDVLLSLGADPEQPVLVVMDPTLMRREGADLKALIRNILVQAGLQPEALVLQPDATGQVHTDMPHIEVVQDQLASVGAVLSVGSGVVTDIAKHGCYLYQQATGRQVPFVVFQTANSVSAYTSNMAPTFVDGVKRTLASRYPDALICDLETLRDAPYEMTVAGVGDLLAAFVSFPDWYLAHILGLDPGYSPLPKELMGPIDEIFLAEAEGIRAGDLKSVAVLAKLIALGGLAMSLAHATTPMSGYEHVISHILDLINEQSGRPLAFHGTQVALATLLGTETYRHFLAEFEPAEVSVESCYPSADTMHQRIQEAFCTLDPSGRAGEECWSDYQQKLEAWHAHRAEFQAFLAGWPQVKPQLEELAQPTEKAQQILEQIRSPRSFAELNPPFSEDQVRFAFLNAPLMRKRLTIGDLLIFTSWDRDQLWRAIWPVSQGG